AAITVPMVTNYLGQAKERAYDADVKAVQAAVDAYYSAPGNDKFTGKRQYPILGAAKASSTPGDLYTDGADVGTAEISPDNPLGGAVGGNPVWLDDGDGIRSEENLNGPADPDDEDGWHMATAVRETKIYYVDTRDYIIDVELLVDAGLLGDAPASAADDNCPTTVCTGSYIYYMDADGQVQTLLASFPVVGSTGFQDVHP
ncbi:MAG: hypothetical protein HW388_1306, partial [Dehalococcoidia bacterium]|nr:hypothetical protein [Dehalococcoidia bacterium]